MDFFLLENLCFSLYIRLFLLENLIFLLVDGGFLGVLIFFFSVIDFVFFIYGLLSYFWRKLFILVFFFFEDSDKMEVVLFV